MAFEIFFFGLIAHIQVENSNITRAVLVDEPPHKAALVVHGTSIAGRSDANLPSSTVDKDGYVWFDLKGWHVRIDGVADQQTTRQPSFHEHVVPLREWLIDADPTKKKPKKDIHDKKTIKDVTASYFDYQDGSIGVPYCYPEAVTMNPSSVTDRECVALVTAYSLPTRNDVITLILTNDAGVRTAISVWSDKTVAVVNMAPGAAHYMHYRELAAGAGSMRKLEENPKRACSSCTPHDRAAAAPAAFPPLLTGLMKIFSPMNPECTQTGYP